MRTDTPVFEPLEPRLLLSGCGCASRVESSPPPEEAAVAVDRLRRRAKGIRYKIGFASAVERDTGQTTAMTFKVRRTGPKPLLSKGRVRYTTAPLVVASPAVQGTDFLAAAGTLRFKAGQRVASLTVTVLGNEAADDNRSFAVVLSKPKGGKIQRGTGVGVILDDDAPGVDLQLVSQSLVSNDDNLITMQLTVRNNGGTTSQSGQVLFVATATGFPGVSFPDDPDAIPGPVYRLLNQFNLGSVSPGQTMVQTFIFDTNPAIHCTDSAGRTDFGGYIQLRAANDVNNSNNTQTMVDDALLPAPDTNFSQGCNAGWVTTPP